MADRRLLLELLNQYNNFYLYEESVILESIGRLKANFPDAQFLYSMKCNPAGRVLDTVFGQGFGNIFVAVCLLFFAFSTILSWNFFGKLNVEYLFGKKGVKVYSVIAIVFIFLGSCLSNDLVWELADMFNQLMVIPNAIALVLLSGIVVKAARGGEK